MPLLNKLLLVFYLKLVVAVGTLSKAEAAAILSNPVNVAKITSASAIAEGSMAAGSAQESGRQAGKEWHETAGYSVLSGAITAVITKGASKFIPDAETSLITGGITRENLKRIKALKY